MITSGTINFVDVTVDRSTDTVLVRATFPNPASALIEGQLVRVELESGNPERRWSIPQAALIADQEGVYVFVVDGGKAAVRRIKTGGESGQGIVVETGLAGGEQVIVEGLQRVRPGVPVVANPLPPSSEPELRPMLSAIFVDRPRLAIVIAIVTTIAGRAGAICHPDCPVSGYRAAAGFGHDHLSGRQSLRGRCDDRAADRGAGRRRRQDDLYEERERR